jgi:hypothetical protein
VTKAEALEEVARGRAEVSRMKKVTKLENYRFVDGGHCHWTFAPLDHDGQRSWDRERYNLADLLPKEAVESVETFCEDFKEAGPRGTWTVTVEFVPAEEPEEP